MQQASARVSRVTIFFFFAWLSQLMHTKAEKERKRRQRKEPLVDDVANCRWLQSKGRKRSNGKLSGNTQERRDWIGKYIGFARESLVKAHQDSQRTDPPRPSSTQIHKTPPNWPSTAAASSLVSEEREMSGWMDGWMDG